MRKDKDANKEDGTIKNAPIHIDTPGFHTDGHRNAIGFSSTKKTLCGKYQGQHWEL